MTTLPTKDQLLNKTASQGAFRLLIGDLVDFLTGIFQVNGGTILGGALHQPSPATITSVAGILTLTEAGNSFLVNGSEAITAITGWTAGVVLIRWNTARTLTHNAASLILQGGQNRLTAVGDVGVYEVTAAGTREINYFTAAFTNPAADVAGGEVDRMNTIFEMKGAYPSISGGAITLTAEDYRLINPLTGAYAYLAAGTYTLSTGGALVANWDYKTNYAPASPLTPTVVAPGTPPARPHYNMFPIAYYDGVSVYFRSGWAFPPYSA